MNQDFIRNDWEDDQKITEKVRSKEWARKWLIISLVLILISCMGASALQSNFYKTQVYTFKLPTSDGKYLSCNMFRPKEATAENKVPIVIATAGTYASKEQMDTAAVELSRRGIAVITFDPYMHGLSSGGTVPYSEFAWDDAGMTALVEYAANELSFVDTSKIGITGHSLGGRIITNTLARYGVAYEKALEEAKKPDSPGGEEITPEEQALAEKENKVFAAFPTGVKQKEISFGNSNDATSVAHGFSGAPEGFAFPKKIYANLGIYNGFNDEYNRGNHIVDGKAYSLATDPDILSIFKHTFDQDFEEIELDKFYGTAEDRTLRIVHNPPELHAMNRFSLNQGYKIVEFFEKSFGTRSGIPLTSQIWLTKHLFNTLGLIGMFLLLVPLVSLLLKTPFFQDLQKPVADKTVVLESSKQKLTFWIPLILAALLSWWFFMPAIEVSNNIFPLQAKQATLTATFPQKMTNFMWVWATFNAIVSAIFLFILNRKNKQTMSAEGIENNNSANPYKVSKKYIGKTVLLTLLTATIFFSIVYIANFFFQTDFRFWTLAIKTAKPIHMLHALGYSLMFIPFYFMIALSTNVGRRVIGQKEGLNLFICGMANILGLLLAQAALWIQAYARGIHNMGPAVLNCIQTYQLLILLFVATIWSRYLYRLTGKLWLSTSLPCIVVVTINVFNSMLHIAA